MKFLFSIILFLPVFSGFSQNYITEAKSLLNQGEISRAKEILVKGKEENDLVQAELLLGDIASFEKDWDVAIEHYQKLVKYDPSNAGYNFRLGGALGFKALNVSKFGALVLIPDVKKHLEAAAELDKKHRKSRRALVELYMQLPGILGGSEGKSLKYAKELEKIDALEGFLAQAYIHKEKGNKKEAVRYSRLAIDHVKQPFSDPEKNNLNYEIGKISAEYNLNLSKGLQFLDAYLQNNNYLDLHSPEWVYLRKAQIFAHLKNKDQAVKSIDKALALNRNFKEAKQEKTRILKL